MNLPLSRRTILAGLLAAAAGPAIADAPVRSPRPVSRDSVPASARGTGPRARTTLEQVIADAGLDGSIGVALADVATGTLLESHNASEMIPPASVTKTITSMYALHALGPDYRFDTRLIATGPVTEGVLQGDLILTGGGDPSLLTDDLADMARLLDATGLKEVSGAFLVWGGALPGRQTIDPTQLDYLGYNPAIGGLNLNFNRVYFEWTRVNGTYQVSMDARSDTARPAVSMARMEVVDRPAPLFTYQDGGGVDEWTVARVALGKSGSRWLPVRYPALYAGEVLRSLARSRGIKMAEPVEVSSLPEGVALVTHQSAPLTDIIRDMLKYSTNLTAEILGLAATKAAAGYVLPTRDSARRMAIDLLETAGVAARFADHSGLSDESHISARSMVRFLTTVGTESQISPLLKHVLLTGQDGKALPNQPAEVVAKTGTLNFASALAGYVRAAGRSELAFAIFSINQDRREATRSSDEELPEGASAWNTKAKALQQTLLKRWAAMGQAN